MDHERELWDMPATEEDVHCDDVGSGAEDPGGDHGVEGVIVHDGGCDLTSGIACGVASRLTSATSTSVHSVLLYTVG